MSDAATMARRRLELLRADALLRLAPQRAVEVGEPLEVELALLAMDLRRLAHGDHRSLDGQRAAAAHRVEESHAAVVACELQDRGGERFLERRRMALLAVAALVQRLAGSVEAQHAAAARDMRDDHDLRLVGVHRRHAPPASAKASRIPSRTCVMTCRCDSPWLSSPTLSTMKRVTGVEQFRPVHPPHLGMQHGRRVRRHFPQHAQDPACGAQAQVQLVELLRGRLEQHGAKGRRQFRRAERLEFGHQRGLRFLRAGRDQSHGSPREPLRSVIDSLLSRCLHDGTLRPARHRQRAVRGGRPPSGQS